MEIMLFETLILDYARIDGAFSQLERIENFIKIIPVISVVENPMKIIPVNNLNEI
jgi:hypothetical protein